MDRKQKIQIGILAIFVILIIIAVWGVFQRQLFQKKAAKTGQPVSVQWVAAPNALPGSKFESSIQMVSNQILPISGAEATVNVSDKFTIDTTLSKCIAPFDTVTFTSFDNQTHTATFLCAIDPATLNNNLPTLQIGQPMQFARIVLTVNTGASGTASITFQKTRVTQAKVANQAPDISNDGTNTTYQIGSTTTTPSPTIAVTATSVPTATGTANRPPNCSGGITITGKTEVAGKYLVTKGETVQLVANNITDPDGDAYSLIQGTTFRFKNVATPTGTQCPTTNDGSLISGTNNRGSDDAGLTVNWYQTWDTTNVAVGDYYVWANPSDGPNSYCSGNPFYTPTNTCGAPAECTNCEGRVLISVAATGTSAPTPTPTIPITQPPIGEGILFNIWAPDVLPVADTIDANNVQIVVYNGTTPISAPLNPQGFLVRNGNYYTGGVKTTLGTNLPQTGQYSVVIKLGNTIQRTFRNVTLTKGQVTDCRGTSVGSCGELVSQRDIKTLISGDSNKFNRQDGSFNRIDIDDYNKYIVERFGGANNLLTDFNGDGIISVSDLAIWAKNEGVVGDNI